MKLNTGTGIYLDIQDQDFYKSIATKKEYFDNRVSNISNYNCLQPQQKFLANFINPLTNYNSVLIYHSVGVGKTLSAISIAENFKFTYNILVIVKNKLIELNFKKELLGICSNYTDPKDINKYYKFITYGTIVNDIKNGTLKNVNNTIIIIDEVNNILGNDTYVYLNKLLKKSKNFKTVLLSATPIYDNIIDVFELCNLLNDTLPTRSAVFRQNLLTNSSTFSNSENIFKTNVNQFTPKGRKLVLDSLKGKVSYLIIDPSFFPKKEIVGTPISKMKGSINIYKTNMSTFQDTIYQKVYKDNINSNVLFNDASNVLTMVYPDSSYGTVGFIKNIKKNKNKDFLKLENILMYSSKIHSILVNIKKSPGPCFIYSNYVNNGGTSLIKEVLLMNGYSLYNTNNDKPKFIVLDDTIDYSKRTKIIHKFNNKDNAYGNIIKIIVGSPVISEGITLKSIRQIHILEPYWNLSRIEQIIGRGIRFKSHNFLDPAERNCKIFLHVANSKKFGNTIDYFKYELSEQKDIIIKDLEYNIKTIAVDCTLNKSRNKLNSLEYDYTRECQYKLCNYLCPYENAVTDKITNDTYDINIHDKKKYIYILNKIKELYKQGHIFSLSFIVNYIRTNQNSIEKENIYYVLTDIIDNNIKISNPLNINCYILPVKKYYIAIPITATSNKEQYFNFIFNLIKEYKNLNEVFNIKETKKKIKHQKLIDINPDLINKSIYGIYHDKLNNIDNKFRIIDNRNKANAKEEDKRNLIYGKVCTFYSKEDLISIIEFLKIKLPENYKYTKINLCNTIENYLKKNKLIF